MVNIFTLSGIDIYVWENHDVRLELVFNGDCLIILTSNGSSISSDQYGIASAKKISRAVY